MENKHRHRSCKFFRGLIASRQPAQIDEIVERYNKDLKGTEASYFDLVIKSGGLVSYEEILNLPIDSLSLFVERLNKNTEEKNQAQKGQGRM